MCNSRCALCAEKAVVGLVHAEREILVHCWFHLSFILVWFFCCFFFINIEALILKITELGSNVRVFCSFSCYTSVIGDRTYVVHHELKDAAAFGFHDCQGQEFDRVQQLSGMGSKSSVTWNWLLDILNSLLNTWNYLMGLFSFWNFLQCHVPSG